MRKVSSAGIIVGIILMVLGCASVLFGLFGNKNFMESEQTFFIFILLAIVGGSLFIAGLVLVIVFGVRKARVKAGNRQYMEAQKYYRGKTLATNCIYCGRQVTAYAEDFHSHRNYPEGFIYCPVCKKPLSINAFDIVDDIDE